MNDYLPEDELRDKSKPKPPSRNRMLLWLVVGGIGLYYVISGVMGIVNAS